MEYIIRLSKDIHSLSEFRAQASSVIEKVKEKGRVAVITQNGKGAAVLMGVDFFEELSELSQHQDIAKEPAVAYKSQKTMNIELLKKMENLSDEEQRRLSSLIDTLITPTGIPKELPSYKLGGKLDKVNIRKIAHED